MINKSIFVLKNKYMYLKTDLLIKKCLDNNYLISKLAIDELIKRNLNNIDVTEDILVSIIEKMSIEQIWFIVSKHEDNHFTELVISKLYQILDYYQNINKNDYLAKLYNTSSGKVLKIN